MHNQPSKRNEQRAETIKIFPRELTGIRFTGCSVSNETHAQAGGRRRQVIVKGHRVKTIDVHAHCLIAEATALMKVKGDRDERFPALVGMIPERLQAMDEQGIDIEALSINPFWYRE